MSQEWRSKILDTLVVSAVLIVINFALVMLVSVMERVYARPGLFVFAFLLMVILIFCLERATTLHLPESWRARSGILGGFLAWGFVDLAITIGQQKISIPTDLLVLIMTLLITVTLWRRSFSTGLQFFSITFLLGWMGQIILGGFAQLQNGRLLAYDVFFWAAVVFGSLSLGVIGWSMLRSRTRIQRLMMAILLWFSLMIVLYSMRGGTI